jgi:hypothetical protein
MKMIIILKTLLQKWCCFCKTEGFSLDPELMPDLMQEHITLAKQLANKLQILGQA